MPYIIPMEKLKEPEEVSKMCMSRHEPVFITKEGFGDMVVMCMEDYDTLKGKADAFIEWRREKRNAQFTD